MTTDPVVIVSYARTPMGGFQGAFSGVKATELGATAVKAAVERAGVSGDAIERIYMGCVLPAGLGQAPARQAALGAGLPTSVEATTVNKMCGSGMQAAIMAYDALAAGSIDVAIAGGMESMTGAPYLMSKHRAGARIGHDTVYDHMMLDGLEDAYEPGKAMGVFAEEAGAGLSVHAGRSGRLCDPLARARQRGYRNRRLRARDHAGDGIGPQGRGNRRYR
jgi:acetyl-CoA C-acetyltransferase